MARTARRLLVPRRPTNSVFCLRGRDEREAELTERHGVEHAGVGRGADALVDDADSVLHGALGHVHVQAHDEEGHKEAVDEVLGETHQNAHPVPGQVPGRPPGATNTITH